jgi:hypothetical protein
MSSPNPQNTYAVVVGIEKYNKSPNLPGAASSSLKFAKWLSDLSVPPGNILLFISELDNNKKLFQGCNFNKKEATRNNIYKGFFEEITQKSGDLLYIFWAGHGFISDINSCRLSYSDDNENFNLSSLLKSLRSKTFPNFNKQIILIDACAIYATKISSKHFYGEQLYKEEYPIGGVKNNNEQVVLLASKEGHTAKYEENTGLFSKVLLEELQGKQKLLLPEEMRAIQDNVVRRFEKEYNNEQKPISFYFIDKDGNQIGLNKSAKDNILVQANWERLKPILSKIDGYKLYLACWLLLSESTKDKDIDGNYPKINTLKSQYTKVEDIPDILWEVLFIDINQNEEEKAIFIILKFVSYLIQIVKYDDLKEWNENFKNQLHRQSETLNLVEEQIIAHLTNLKQQYESCQPYLMIYYKTDQSKVNKVNLSAELIFQKNNNKKPSLIITIAGEIECLEGLENIKEQVDHFISFTIKTIKLYGFKNEQLIIEMFLPDNELIKPAEQSYEKISIKIDISDNRKWIGGHYKFTLRSSSRLENINAGYIDLDSITEKWNQLNNNPQVKWVDYPNITSNINNSDVINTVGIRLVSTATIFQQKNSINQVLQGQVINQGLPLFVWIICDEEELKQEVIDTVLTESNLTNLDGLLKTIKDKRSYSHENHQQQKCWGYYLGFLCDNPHRLPSQYSTIGGNFLISF